MINQSRKNLNIEFLRVIAMLMIITGHSIGHTYLLEEIAPNSVNHYLVSTLQVFCYVATNIYVMISGYLLCDKRIKASRIVSFWVQVAFYSFILFIMAVLLGYAPFSLSGLLKAVMPISGNQYWFARVYFGLYLLSPFINIFARTVTKKQYQAFLIVCTILFSLWRTFLPFATTLNSEGGNSIIWFVILYLFGAYVRIYGAATVLRFGRIALAVPVCLLLFAFITREVLGVLSQYLGMGGKGTSLFTEFTAFPMLLSAWLILMLTVTHKERKNVRGGVLLWFSSSTFSVYLIHENMYVKSVMWDAINILRFSSAPMLVFIIIAIALLIFAVCTLVDKVLFVQVNRLISGIKLDKIQALIDRSIYSS